MFTTRDQVKAKYDELEFEQEKAQSYSLGLIGFHTDILTHENSFDQGYLEHQYQEAAKRLEALPNVKKEIVEEAGCLPLVAYKIGNPETIITSHIHGDETGPALLLLDELTKLVAAGKLKNVLIIPRCNEEAYKQLKRGVRLDEELFKQLSKRKILNESEQSQIYINDKVQVKLFAVALKYKGYHVSDDEDGFYIDLNRQFIEHEYCKPPKLTQLYPKARQLYRAVLTYAPHARYGFSFHADNTITDSYIYDTPKRFPSMDQADEQHVLRCVREFQKRMSEAHIPLFTGIDDPEDSLLGMNPVINGYTCTPALEKMKDGEIVDRTTALHDQTFETSMVRWFEMLENFLCFETSGKINIRMRTEMIRILLETFVIPLSNHPSTF